VNSFDLWRWFTRYLHPLHFKQTYITFLAYITFFHGIHMYICTLHYIHTLHDIHVSITLITTYLYYIPIPTYQIIYCIRMAHIHTDLQTYIGTYINVFSRNGSKR
jgi:hypothetical protein